MGLGVLGVWGSQQPSQPEVSAGCSEAVYLLAPSADGHWLAAVSGDWAIHIYNLKCFKVGLGVTPQPQGMQDGGAQQAGSPQEPSLHPWSRAGVRVWERGQSPRFCPGWVCGRGVSSGAISALSPLAASLHSAHLQLRRISSRHPPQHQQPRHRLLGPAGRSCPGGALLPSLCLSPCLQGFLAWLGELAAAACLGCCQEQTP